MRDSTKNDSHRESEFEYVVVGSGAGGGTVAAGLAERGHKVLLLEAGSDPLAVQGGDPLFPDQNRAVEDYRVPAFHPFASENEAFAWDFFVRYHDDEDLQRRDPKYMDSRRGVLYPRGAALGGTTALNALIFAYPFNEDWNHIAGITRDASWSAENMRKYLVRIENCHQRPGWRLFSRLGINPTRHGFNGWLHTEKALPSATLEDKALTKVIAESFEEALEAGDGSFMRRVKWGLLGKLDPNDWRLVQDNATGVRYLPLTTRNHERNGSRERVIDVARRFPERLTIELNALVTRVLLDESNRATGVEFLKGDGLYRAGKKPSTDAGQRRKVHVGREVILAGGAFNSPQLLKLSGIGPQTELDAQGIPVRVDLPGVGNGLQDRKEVAIVSRMNFDQWNVLEQARFSVGDRPYASWARRREGFYTTNGSLVALFQRSTSWDPCPDVVSYAIIGSFGGYHPGYSLRFAEARNYLSWVVRKGRTQDVSGSVTLRSPDPRDTPEIRFRYFDREDGNEDDLRSMIEGIKLVRRITKPLRRKGLIAEEEFPGESVQSDQELAEFVRANVWGTDASCSCAIGDVDVGGVVNGNFEVHGTRGLRVVDASVFPRIPGTFIASAVYMIGEKAVDVITGARHE